MKLDPDVVTVQAPRPLQKAFSILATELGEPGIEGRFALHAMARSGRVWLDLDQTKAADRLLDKGPREFPVFDVTRDHLRVVVTEDGARWVGWIAREDAYTSPIATIQLADRDGHAHRTAGVWVEPGSIVEPGEATGHLRGVHVRDAGLDASGWLPIAALDQVYPVQPKRPDPTTNAKLDRATAIRVAPALDAAVIATTIIELQVSDLATAGEFHEIDVPRPFGHVRGFVAASAVHADPEGWIGHGEGWGHGFGMSHTDYATLPLGACLFDVEKGDVIGVNLEAKSRHAYKPNTRMPDLAGWWKVLIDSPWGTVTMVAHDTANDVQNPVWELCGSYRH